MNHNNLTDKMFEYNLWANTQLIAVCAELDEEQLMMEAEGVFGRIKPTLIHLIRAEGGYLNRVTGSRPWADNLDWNAMSFAELLEKAKMSGQRLIEVASQGNPAVRHTVTWGGQERAFYNWTVISQALYHGIEHRTQIKILLTKLGVEHPELALWDFTESLLANA